MTEGSGKQPCSPHGWTLDTLEKYLTSRIDGLKENLGTAMLAADKAIEKAESATERRFDSVNEFRETLADQSATLLPRAEYLVQHEAMKITISAVEKRLTAMESRSEGRAGGIGTISAVVISVIGGTAGLATIAGVILLATRH